MGGGGGAGGGRGWPYKKSLSVKFKLNKFLERRQENRPTASEEEDRTKGLNKIINEQIQKWNQMTALRFQTGGRWQTFLASLLVSVTTVMI